MFVGAIEILGRKINFARFAAVWFLACGLLLYGAAFRVGFTGDDWGFLAIVAKPGFPRLFQPLAGGFVRPLVVLSYYVWFKTVGIWPAPYHIGLVLLHTFNAWLLCLLSVRLDARGRHLIGLLAGTLFLAFSGHSEAVTWVAGMADPLVAAAALGVPLCIELVLASACCVPWMIAGSVLTVASLLSKETAAVVPLVATAYLLSRSLNRTADPRKINVMRTLVLIGIVFAITTAYWVARLHYLGSPFATYGNEPPSQYVAALYGQTRALILRSLVPPSERLAHLWYYGRDVPLLLLGATVVGGVFVLARQTRPAIAFAVLGMALTLAPAVPLLSISLSTTETERVVYIGSAFAALLTVVCADAIVRHPTAVTGPITALILYHGVVLQQMHSGWRAASTLFSSIETSFGAAVSAHDPEARALILLLNLPDDLHGKYVFRNGFPDGLEFFAPHVSLRRSWIFYGGVQSLVTPGDRVEIRQIAPSEFLVDIRPDVFINPGPPTVPFYMFTEWTRTRYRLKLTSAAPRMIVLGIRNGVTEYLDTVNGRGAPFGVVETPNDGALCSRELRFSGWALAASGVDQIRLIAVTEGQEQLLGKGTWLSGARPDVEAAFPSFPQSQRAAWEYTLRCSSLPRENSGVNIHVIAIDRGGNRQELAVRRVLASPQ